MFYTGIQSSVNVNGILSSFFSLSRGVRQGCPLSPLLYGLVAEVLACNILANPRIKGLCLPGSFEPLSPISQYADDTSLVVCSDDAIRAPVSLFTTRISVAPVPSSIFPSPKAFGSDLGPSVLTRRLLLSGRR